MVLHIVAVFDAAANAFARPIFVPSVGIAMRSFTDEVNRSAADNEMYKHPQDFRLFELGRYDDATGMFDCVTPQLLASGTQVSTREV